MRARRQWRRRPQGRASTIQPRGATHLLFLSGLPLGEPVASRGPFVMNTEEELDLAMAEFQAGKYGRLD